MIDWLMFSFFISYSYTIIRCFHIHTYIHVSSYDMCVPILKGMQKEKSHVHEYELKYNKNNEYET